MKPNLRVLNCLIPRNTRLKSSQLEETVSFLPSNSINKIDFKVEASKENDRFVISFGEISALTD